MWVEAIRYSYVALIFRVPHGFDSLSVDLTVKEREYSIQWMKRSRFGSPGLLLNFLIL